MVGMASSAQIAQNNKFSKSLQYLKKQLRDEMQMSITDLYKIDTIIFDGCDQACLK